MGIGRTFEAAFQKGVRGLDSRRDRNPHAHEPALIDVADDRRAAALLGRARRRAPEELTRRSAIAAWFLRRLGTIVACEERYAGTACAPRAAASRPG